MFIYLNKKAQSTAEYVIVLGLIVAAVLAMQTYVKRGFQGRIKDAVDYVDQGNSTTTIFKTAQYEPGYVDSQFDNTSDPGTGQHNTLGESGVIEKSVSNEKTTRTGSQTTLNVDGEDFED